MDKLQEFMQTAKLSDYIDLMVKALENPKIKPNLGTFGDINGGICVGCAATNALCELSGKVFDQSNITDRQLRANFLGYTKHDLQLFENAIDCIRLSMLDRAATLLKICNKTLDPYYNYPKTKGLQSDYTLKDLIPFKQISTKLKQDGL